MTNRKPAVVANKKKTIMNDQTKPKPVEIAAALGDRQFRVCWINTRVNVPSNHDYNYSPFSLDLSLNLDHDDDPDPGYIHLNLHLEQVQYLRDVLNDLGYMLDRYAELDAEVNEAADAAEEREEEEAKAK